MKSLYQNMLCALLVLAAFSATLEAKPKDPGAGQGSSFGTAQGLVAIAGEAVVVEVLVGVKAGENAQTKARAALKKLYPDVIPVNFALNGLDWDVFHDADPTNDKVTVNYNPSRVPANIAAQDHLGTIQAAMAVWTAVPSSIFAFEFGGLTTREPSLVKESKGKQFFDGNNDLAWVDIREASVLGVTWYGTSTDEFDMAIDNRNFTWFIGDPAGIGAGEYDLQTVLIHEFGHALGLGHSDVEGAILEPYYEGPRRVLSQDDIDGLVALYPAQGVDLPPTVAITAPADGAVFSPGTTITLTGTAHDEDEDLAAVITWSSDRDGYLGMGASIAVPLSLGTHVVTAGATDAEGLSGSDAITVIVRDPSEDPMAAADSISYATTGGRFRDRDLLTTVRVVDDNAQPIAGATVSIRLMHDSGSSWTGTAQTAEDGTVSFKLRNAPTGGYTTEVTGLIAAGLIWDGVTPANSFVK